MIELTSLTQLSPARRGSLVRADSPSGTCSLHRPQQAGQASFCLLADQGQMCHPTGAKLALWLVASA